RAQLLDRPHGGVVRSGAGIAGRVAALAGPVMLLALAAAGAPGAAPSPSSAPAPRRSSVMDSPGYVPLVDPESMSVVIGRRLGVPGVRKPFRGGAPSLDSLGREVCRDLALARRDSLMRLCITDDEFRDILWREFPQSRPAVGLTWVDGWTI